MIESINEEELEFMEAWYDPICQIESLFPDIDNMKYFSENEFGHIRTGQLPMISYEYCIDDDFELSEKYNFQMKEGAGSIWAFGGRLFGKTAYVERTDIPISLMLLDGYKCGFSAYDATHIRGVLEEIIPAFDYHPILKIFKPYVTRHPTYNISAINGFTLESVNMNVNSKAPGNGFFQKHFRKLWIDEASMETEEVYNKRMDSKSEDGCIIRASGMTNFTKYSPAGKVFYDITKKPWIYNLPQYSNPKWDNKSKEKAIKDYNGESSISYRIFVKGEVVEEGVSVFDMQRVRENYDDEKDIKHFEINKENFNYFKFDLVIEKPSNVSCLYVCADIGESAPTEIAIIGLVEKYKYLYNITLYNLTDKQQKEIFEFIADKCNANVIALDTSEGTGRSIARHLEDKYGKEHLVWVSFSEKIPVDFEKDETTGEVVFDSGKPVYREEYIADWSIKRLKDLFYDNKIILPLDYKLDKQLNSVISMQSGNRVIYECFSSDTEILTDQGWKYFKDLNKTEKIATLNSKKNKVEYHKPTNYIKQFYKGKLLENTGRELKFAVTPNHRMFVEKPHNFKRKKPIKEFCEANKLINESIVYKTFPNWEGKDFSSINIGKYNFEGKDFIEFLGWFISEGYCINDKKSNKYRISISQTIKNSKYRNEIKSLLNKMKINYCESPKEFIFHNKVLHKWLSKHCYITKNRNSSSKKAPDFIRFLNRDLINIFLLSYFKGDGHFNKINKFKSSVSKSYKLSSDIQELLLKIGLYSSILTVEGSGFNKKGIYYIVNVNKEKYSKIHLKNIKEIDYENYIYCVTVPNELIYVRYKGKSFWCGNCISEEDHLLSAFRVFSIAEWNMELSLIKPISTKIFCKTGC